MYYGYSKKATSYIAAVAVALIVATVVLSISGAPPKTYDSIAYEKKGITVVLDAGHGGEDPGAIGVSGAYEKDLNLAITLNISSQLKEAGINVILTREDDRLLYKPEENIKGLKKISDLKNRVALANAEENAILVSIHMNSYTDPRYSGLQVWYSENSADSPALAELIQNNNRTKLQSDNHRKIKGAGSSIFLLDKINAPAVLVECGFLSNVAEAKQFEDYEYKKQVAFIICCSIIEFLYVEDQGN